MRSTGRKINLLSTLVKKFNGFLAAITFILLPVIGLQISVYADDVITVKLNDKTIEFDAQPFVENGRTLVPIRAITESMNCDVEWDADTETAVITNAGIIVSVRIGSNRIIVNDLVSDKEDDVLIDVPAKIYEERTFVPLRAISEAFGAEVSWNGEKKLVSINYDIPVPITFKDEAVEYIVRYYLVGCYNLIWKDSIQPYSGIITEQMLENIISIDTDGLPEQLSVHSLEDITMMPNLQRISVRDQKDIKDISPITCKDKWDALNFNGISIKDDSALSEIEVTDGIGFPNYDMYLYISSSMSYNDALQAYRSIQEQIEAIDSKINKASSDYDKYKLLHDYLVNNTEYDYDFVERAGDAGIVDPIYLSLFAGKGQCWVYAQAFQRLCRRYGLECWVLDGDAKGILHKGQTPYWGSHEWNIVKLDGNYYHLDATWDDPVGSNSLRYNYFLVSDSTMKSNHKWGGDEYGKNMFDFTVYEGDNMMKEIPECPDDYRH